MAVKHSITSDKQPIRIRGAAQNNLRHIDLDIAPGTITVVSGPSGSGKSSLAFDTLYAEGQRRYVETFSPYARQFLDRCDRPKVDLIDAVPPAIAIEQSNAVRTSRSTVGTMTELNDHLKLLFARQADLYCGTCGEHVRSMSPSDMFEDLSAWAADWPEARIFVAFFVTAPSTLSLDFVRQTLDAQGFTHILDTAPGNGATDHLLTVASDRFKLSRVSRSRGIEAFEKALQHTKTNRVRAVVIDTDGNEHQRNYVTGLTCPNCSIRYSAPSPSRFSFNSAVGACDTCRGFGRVIGIDLGLIIPDPSLTLAEGAVKPWQGQGFSRYCQDDLMRCAKRAGIRTNVPYEELSEAEKTWLIEGGDDWNGNWDRTWYGIRRFFAFLETKAYKMHVRVMLSRYRSYTECPVCKGARLKSEGLFWRVGDLASAQAALSDESGRGRYRRFCPAGMGAQARSRIDSTPGLTVHDLMALPVKRLLPFFRTLRTQSKDEACTLVIDEILTRLSYLIDVGLGYLTLGRQSRTLSGGEVQRVNLTTALGTRLVDTLFVLDEPSVGLHPRDMDRVNAILARLKNAGNTLVVVEHDPQVMLCGDRLIEMGPGAGEAGGTVVYDGTPQDVKSADSLTGLYLSGKRSADGRARHVRPEEFKGWLGIEGACSHNLQNVDVAFPLGAMTAVTGVSGSGKSSLIGDVLVPALERFFGRSAAEPACRALKGAMEIDDVRYVDQSPIGKSSRSNPVVYVGAFSPIRNLFARTQAARERGYEAGTFSFNTGTGRCPTCQGAGFERVEMQFLSDVYLRCPDCDGRRYRPEVLEVTINLHGQGEKSIADVLDMTVTQALAYFAGFREITDPLQPLADVGLGYIRLGQAVSTLSGGEAQRLKLAEMLGRSRRERHKRVLYVFDEPTTGLHFSDIEKLLKAMGRLIEEGNGTVIVIEHNLDVINASDWIVDLGPDGGDEGGRIVAQCTPNELITKHPESLTGRALEAWRDMLVGKRRDMTGLFAAPTALPAAAGRSLQSVWRRARQGDMGIFGAREHNLKNLDAVIPKNELTVVTGVSGSGKSTLAFGIVFSEGQRRYLESLNAYARSIAQPAPRADVESVVGIAPTVAIEQRTSRGGRKSTVSTLTEIQHFLRLLYVKLGDQHCPKCGISVTSRTREAIVADIMRLYRGRTITVAAPLVVARKGIYTDLAQWAQKTMQIDTLRVDGKWVPVAPFPSLARYKEHTIEMPTATLAVVPEHESELIEAVDKALFHGHGVITVLSDGAQQSAPPPSGATGQSVTYSIKRACPRCQTSFPDPDPRLFSFNSKIGWCPACFGTGLKLSGFDAEQTGEEAVWNELTGAPVCPECGGARLNAVARSVYFAGRSIAQTTALSVDDCLKALEAVHLEGREKAIGEDAVKEIVSRLRFLQKVGLGYLSLDRDAPSLSGGEAQRIRLASQLGSTLQGVCYVLDEPTIGLHARDNALLIDALTGLRDKGNTVVVVEHDEEMIRRADHVIDIGPGAGTRGGTCVAMGSVADIMAAEGSVTGRYLRSPLMHDGRSARPLEDCARLRLARVTCHNIRDLSIDIPLGRLVVLTGVSGSGKSTLARDVLLPNLSAAVQNKGVAPSLEGCGSLQGAEQIDRVLEVDQTPIGKNPRSCPATYVGFFNKIRDLFAATPEAQARGYEATRFSFNTAVGRCPVCEGNGEVTVAMSFLPDVKVACEACGGMRFDEETLSVRWRDRSIGQILNMPVDEAVEFFASSPSIARPLELLQAVGLGYLRLGQPSSTLSGGEAQRIKLVTELAKASTSAVRSTRHRAHTFYILDEPTVGLHMSDVEKLIAVLQRLVDAGNTVLVIEHNLDVVAEADCVIDLGPEGGPAGGRIVAQGAPSQVARCDTPTGRALRAFLSEHQMKNSTP